MQNCKLLKLAARYPDLAWGKIKEKIWVKFLAVFVTKTGTVWVPPPRAVGINVTHPCNLRCKMCGQWRRKDTYRKEILPIGKLKEIVDEVVPFGFKMHVWGGSRK